VSSFSVLDGVATINLETPHGLSEGDFVRVTFTSPIVDGTYEITNIPSATSIQYDVDSANTTTTAITAGAIRKLYDTYEFVRDLIYRMETDLSEYSESFGNEIIEPARTFEASVIYKEVQGGVITLKTLDEHYLVPGQEFEVYGIDPIVDELNPWIISEVPDSKTLIFEAYADDTPPTVLAGIRTLFITNRSVDGAGTATITTHLLHGAQEGDKIVISKVDSPFNQRLDINFDGAFIVESVTSNTISYALETEIEILSEPVYGGLITLGNKIIYSTYGPYTGNSNLDFQFDNTDLSNKYQDTQVIRGYENKTVGEILEDYSDNINGFEYRVDCDFDPYTGSFLRIFTILDIENPNGSVEYQGIDVADLTDEQRIGYNKLVFEYPGSISTFTVEENAENSATRFFVQGSITDLSDEASQPYAAAVDIDQLNNKNGASWPLLDQLEIINNTADEDILYDYAQEYLYESKVPMGDISIRINGSITPTIGSFYPGDWCTIIIDDPFVLSRLANDQEPRNDIIVRKINSYKVSVPDNSFFPEDVDIELITDWKVDKTGQTYGLRATGGNN
jgi:hypothetical protein